MSLIEFPVLSEEKDFTKQIKILWNEKIKKDFKTKLYDFILDEFHDNIKTKFFTIDLPKECEKKRIVGEIIEELNKCGYNVKLCGSENLLQFFSNMTILI